MKIICTVLAFVVLILGLPAVAGAAVAFDAAASTSSTSSTTTLSWTHTASGINRVVIVGVSYISTSGTATATYAGTSMTVLGSVLTSSDNRMAMFLLVNPPTGAQTVTVTFSASASTSVGGSVSMMGADQTTPTGAFFSATGTSSPGSLTVTSTTGELVIDNFQCDTACGSITPGGSQTQRWNLQPGGQLGGGSTQAGAASVPMSWTFPTTDHWSYGAVSVKAAVIGAFNAYETSTAAGAIWGFIKTKIAGATVSLDMIALNSTETAIDTSTTWSGITVNVEVLDSSNNTGALDANACRSTWVSTVPATSVNKTFPTCSSPNCGRTTISLAMPANSYPNARLRISYPTSSPTSIGCSTDNFAIRPNTFTSLSVKDTDWQTAGTGRTLNLLTFAATTPIHKAGRPFTVRATAVNAAGTPATTTNYTSTPTPTLTACVGAACTATFGTVTLGASTGGGALTWSAATYSDVGSFKLQLVDSTFASVDASDGSTTAERNITSNTTINVGRFVPDHFAVALNTPVFGTACVAGGFTYIGQAFNYTTAPVITVTAQDFANNTTTLYATSGSWWRITNASLTGKAYTVAVGTLNTSGTPGTDPVIAASGGGIGTLTFGSGTGLLFTRTTPVAPFNADVSLAINVIDADGVTYASNPARFGAATAGNGIAFSSGKPMRFGRLALGNALGSEVLNLPIPIQTQYWNGTSFVTNTLDSCTTIIQSNIVLSNYQPGLTSGNLPSGNIIIGGAFNAGVGNLKLTKPLSAVVGSVDLSVGLGAAGMTYLQGAWAGTTYTFDPRARAAFGFSKGSYSGSGRDPFVYQRENY